VQVFQAFKESEMLKHIEKFEICLEKGLTLVANQSLTMVQAIGQMQNLKVLSLNGGFKDFLNFFSFQLSQIQTFRQVEKLVVNFEFFNNKLAMKKFVSLFNNEVLTDLEINYPYLDICDPLVEQHFNNLKHLTTCVPGFS
jgi:hypothetical protein